MIWLYCWVGPGPRPSGGAYSLSHYIVYYIVILLLEEGPIVRISADGFFLYRARTSTTNDNKLQFTFIIIIIIIGKCIIIIIIIWKTLRSERNASFTYDQ